MQKLCSDYFSAYGQATVRHGGRNGVALTAGFKWSLGKDSKPIDHVYAPVPEKVLTAEPKHILAPVPVSSKTQEPIGEIPVSEKKIIKQMTKAQRAAYEKQTTKADVIGVLKNL